MGCAKKNCLKNTKNWVKNARYTLKSLYYILFNFCGRPGVYHRNQNKKKQVLLSLFDVSGLEMCIYLHCFIQNWEHIESLKNEISPGIVLEKSWNSVFPFPYTYEPWSRLFWFIKYMNQNNLDGSIRTI